MPCARVLGRSCGCSLLCRVLDSARLAAREWLGPKAVRVPRRRGLLSPEVTGPKRLPSRHSPSTRIHNQIPSGKKEAGRRRTVDSDGTHPEAAKAPRLHKKDQRFSDRVPWYLLGHATEPMVRKRQVLCVMDLSNRPSFCFLVLGKG